MAEVLEEKRIAEWNRYIEQRVSRPLYPEGVLRPERVQSAFIIVPGSSGDVVLATTLVRYIKDRNQNCRVSFAVKKSNLPLIQLCPGVDEVVEWPRETETNPRSRRHGLTKYADKADVVIYPICDPEDMDLLLRYNFMETIWLLAGVPDGMPPELQTLWVTPPHDVEEAARILKRCTSREFALHLIAEASRQPAFLLRTAMSQRKFKDVGWKTTPVASVNLVRNALFVQKSASHINALDAGSRFVIMSNEANMFPRPAKGVFEKIFLFFQNQGRIVLQNVLNPANAFPGAIPLVCSYHEFLCLRELGIPFVGWRSGLCDIAAVSKSPMGVIYPGTFAGCDNRVQSNMDSPIKSFGFASMNVAANFTEQVCDSPDDVDLQKIAMLLA